MSLHTERVTGTGGIAAGDLGIGDAPGLAPELGRAFGAFHALAGLPSRDGSEVVEVLDAAGAVTRYAALQESATDELLRFDTPPYSEEAGHVETELGRLAAGVTYRVVYSADALALPGRAAAMELLAAAGEQARSLPVVPAKLAIADRRVALLPLHSEQPTAAAVVVHGQALVGLLTVMFEEHWRRAVPVAAASDLTPTARRILTMLAAGAKDESIARQLGVTERTVRRHVRAILGRLDAKTRLEAALRARELGWI